MRKFIMSEETGGANENGTHLLSRGSNAKLKFTPDRNLRPVQTVMLVDDSLWFKLSFTITAYRVCVQTDHDSWQNHAMRSRNCKQICTRGGQLFRWHLKFLVKLRVKVTEAFQEAMRINSKRFNAKFWRLLLSFYYFLFQFKTVFSKLLTENHSLSSASSHGNFSSTIMRTWKWPKYVIIDESDSSCSNTRDSWKYPQLSPINYQL